MCGGEMKSGQQSKVKSRKFTFGGQRKRLYDPTDQKLDVPQREHEGSGNEGHVSGPPKLTSSVLSCYESSQTTRAPTVSPGPALV